VCGKHRGTKALATLKRVEGRDKKEREGRDREREHSNHVAVTGPSFAVFKIEVFNARQKWFGPSKQTSLSLKTTLQDATPN
jgi:hypothetical protein